MKVRRLGRADYVTTWEAMRAFTAARDAATPDELWRVEHPPVYTLGVAARSEHLPRRDDGIALVHADRGGQSTYHGPGQVVLYTLLDLTRRGLSVRALVRLLEAAVIELLARHGVHAQRRDGAPGVSAGAAKVASLGLRVRHGRCYHGLALNVDMDLGPFGAIDPCGYPGLAVTDMRRLGIVRSPDAVGEELTEILVTRLNEPALSA